jgi:hypothetical protein
LSHSLGGERNHCERPPGQPRESPLLAVEKAVENPVEVERKPRWSKDFSFPVRLISVKVKWFVFSRL